MLRAITFKIKVTKNRTNPKANADRVLVGACKLKKANKAQKGFFEKKKSEAFRYLREFSIDKDTEFSMIFPGGISPNGNG